MIKIESSATLLTADSKPYEIDGNSGVSHKARFLIENEIYSLRSNEEDIKTLQSYIEKEQTDFNVEVAFTSAKENLKAELVSFETI